MKIPFLGLTLLVAAGSVCAQQQQQGPPVQMQCRELSTSGNFLYPNETVVNGMACHVVDPKQPAPASASSKPTPAAPAPSASQTPASAQAGSAQIVPANAPAPTGSAAVTPLNLRISPGATVYIEPMEGFENYLAAALQKKHVPLLPVTNESQATYILKGSSDEKKAGWAKVVFMGQIHSDNAASVQMIDRKTGAVVFAYAVNKKNTLHGQQTTAEACAKHLKEQIERK